MLLLYFDGHGTLFDGGLGPDAIKKRPILPKGYRYLDERPEEEAPRPEEFKNVEVKKAEELKKPISIEDVGKLVEIFKGDLYPASLYRLIDVLEVGIAPSAEELEAARVEADIYRQVAEAQREKELLNRIHEWLLAHILKVVWSEEDILTVLLLAKKNRDIVF